MSDTNEMTLVFDSKSENEGFARVATAAFIAPLNPTMEEISDIKTAVSEAVTNSIIHGYNGKPGKITLHCSIDMQNIRIEVKDEGCGIEDIQKAMEPLYTTKPELERSGMGFAFMEAFMDHLEVISQANQGTKVIMKKTIQSSAAES
ncbi:anti-sigma F factor [Anaeromicropila populeti]|uniref:Anti-sigma F factor n=1 Tax=Anaeromicropila populeti TaxID=37658 RepID=A0A1I6JQN2_9FIRM|nr:anti-sigma F factor [Anaeromicropila populeti]SFR81238.1 stage II sporulation protein AB (anti-sigma F factor) [Anaeromicropila populeti]